MNILIIDDRQDVISSVKRALKFSGQEVFGEPVTTTSDALKAIEEVNPDAIILDMQLQPDGTQGQEIAKELQSRGFEGLIVSHSSLSIKDQKTLLSQYGVKHYAKKGSISLIDCLVGECSCLETSAAKPRLDVLFALLKENVAAGEAFKCGFEGDFAVDYVGPNEKVAEKIAETMPRVVAYEVFPHVGDIFGTVLHDWHHLQMKNNDLPDVQELDVQWVMISWDDMEKQAQMRGHQFSRLPFTITDLRLKLKELTGKEAV